MLSFLQLESLDFKSVLLFFVVFLFIADYLKHRKPPNYPPGPFQWPFAGNVFSIDSKQPDVYMRKLAEVYGDIFSLRLGHEETVVATGYKMVKEALVGQAEIFVDRPYSPMGERMYPDNAGLFFSNGMKWKTHRRFAMTTLRNFGLGKTLMENAICEEIRYLQEEMETQKGDPFNPKMLFNNAVSNIICQLVYGRRYDYSDYTFQKVLKKFNEALYLEGTIWAQLYEAFPVIMKHLPGPHNAIFSNYLDVADFIRKEVERHKEDLDPNNPRDYIDAYITEMQSGSGNDDFTESNLVMNSLDLFLAGTETTSTTLLWALVLLIKHPDVQKKVQSEIDTVIGQSRPPSMADKASMPYTEAVIHEIQRIGNIVPINGLRLAGKDTTLGGYFIPKGTSLLTNLTSVMFDKTEWETPEEFNPGHFLDSEGKFRRRDAFLPFSAGKRVCLGEQLARMELFLFFVGLLQKFSFSTEEGVELSLEGEVGATRTPLPFKVFTHTR
ncbi:cytochrome P450 2J2-like [Engraulis encrasicolus]|uniref:cytochrome P450 2J2-like n=1 Tax=Engraulis encrasicolus TaxID=184585 RepID=UPI002FD50B65